MQNPGVQQEDRRRSNRVQADCGGLVWREAIGLVWREAIGLVWREAIGLARR
jgi:hypothetical protein